MAAGWTHRGDYIVAKHGVTPAQADEALDDPSAVIFDPDYNSKSRDSVRTIGYSPSFGDVLSVTTVEDEGTVHGSNAWKSNSRDRRYYQQGGPDEQES
jgi:uncharacterized DUF497 family protein